MNNDLPIITVIGTGNMGSALISGLIANGHPANKLWASNPSSEKLEHLKKEFGISTSTQNISAARHADLIILAVKPQILPLVAHDLAPLVQQQRPLILSIAAGITLHHLQTLLGPELALVRAMPNMPVLLRRGVSALYANAKTSSTQRQLAESVLAAVGMTLWLSEEKQMDAVTALSGSGPAYFFLFMEALQEAGQKLGLSKEIAHALTLHTADGAICLATESQQDLVSLRRQVTSPGGTTESALQVLEKEDLRGLIEKALRAAAGRAKELSHLFK